jgi:hypothetical protein
MDNPPPQPVQLSSDQQNQLRQQILTIQKDASIPASDKAKKIQVLMSAGWEAAKQKKRQELEPEQVPTQAEQTTERDLEVTYNDRGQLGCKHYQRGAKLQAACCGRWFTCRFCHDDASDHEIVRRDTRTMMCMHCQTVQPCAQSCTHCNIKLARHYCDICKLWDDDAQKSIYHCEKCGLCRVGQGLGVDYFHCDVCNVCLAIQLKDNHKCIERNLESACPICAEYLHSSRTTVIFMPCGHGIHYKCHQAHIRTSYQCPTCLKSLADMTEYFRRIDAVLQEQPMPTEYGKFVNLVFCNDCERRSYATYHFLYHKCGECASYNTKVLQTVLRDQLSPDELRFEQHTTERPARMAGEWPTEDESDEEETEE